MNKLTLRFTLLIASLSFLALASSASAATYYVSKNGFDSNPGTQAQQFLTIGKALSVVGTSAGAGAGKTVEVAAGIYAESLSNVFPSGTSWNAPFTLRAKSGDSVTIKANSDHNIYLDATNGSSMFLIIDGF